MFASYYGHPHIIEELCRKEIPYESAENGLTCIHVAAERGHLAALEVFANYKKLNNKAYHVWESKLDYNARKKHWSKEGGVTPAFLAAKSGHFEVF